MNKAMVPNPSSHQPIALHPHKTTQPKVVHPVIYTFITFLCATTHAWVSNVVGQRCIRALWLPEVPSSLNSLQVLFRSIWVHLYLHFSLHGLILPLGNPRRCEIIPRYTRVLRVQQPWVLQFSLEQHHSYPLITSNGNEGSIYLLFIVGDN